MSETPNSFPRVGAVDVGSNSIKVRLVEVGPDGTRRTLNESRYPVRLGTGVFETGRISDAELAGAVSAFQEIAALVKAFRIDRVRAVATSAAREANNKGELIQAVEEASGIALEVISGREEARLDAVGAKADLAPGRRHLVIDVGGGSTEVVYTRPDGRLESAHSVRLGAVRLAGLASETGADGHAQPPAAVRAIREAVAEVLDRGQLPAVAPGVAAVGVSGTMTAILEAARRARSKAGGPRDQDDDSFSRVELDELLTCWPSMPYADLESRYGIDRRRAAILIPGALVVQGVMALYGLDRMKVSRRGLRDGLVEELAALAGGGAGGGGASDPAVFAAALALGEKYAFDRDHGEHVAGLAMSLFDATADLHRMDEAARGLLRLGALLHDIGQFIAYPRHHRHSHHLLCHEELPGLGVAERAMVAAIARFHRKSAPRADHGELKGMTTTQRLTVERCAALLRVADGLDRQHRQMVTGVGVDHSADGALRVAVKASGRVSLEMSAAATKSALLAKTLGREVAFHAIEG